MREDCKQNRNAKSKLNHFRAEIRKNSIISSIQSQRKKLFQNIDFQDLKTILRNIDTLSFPKNQEKQTNNLILDKLTRMIDILELNCHEASFNLQAQSQNLGEGFSNILVLYANKLSIPNKTNLVSAIDYLTFYSAESSKILIQKQTFVELLRTQIVDLGMNETLDIKYCKMIVVLLMNLASQYKQQFNLYLAQSDICKSINEQIYKTLNIEKHKNDEQYTEAVKQLRKCAIRLFKNVITNFNSKIDVAVKLITQVIKDSSYFQEHADWMFLLLKQALMIEQFWNSILETATIKLIDQYISEAADTIQIRFQEKTFLNNYKQTLTQRQKQSFNALLIFLNQLNLDHSILMNQANYWTTFVQNLLNGFMLAEFTKIAHQDNENEYLKNALTTYCHLSRSEIVSIQQLLIIRPIEDNYVLLKVFTDPSRTSGETGVLCWQILRNILVQDKSYHKQFMQLLIIERIENTLDNKSEGPAVIIQLILFARQLILAFDEVDKILQIFQNKNIINKIQNLINDGNRGIFEKAEIFVELVTQKKKSINPV